MIYPNINPTPKPTHHTKPSAFLHFQNTSRLKMFKNTTQDSRIDKFLMGTKNVPNAA